MGREPSNARPTSPQPAARAGTEAPPSSVEGAPAAAGSIRPSALLRKRCALCFGGLKPSFEHTECVKQQYVRALLMYAPRADVIVCLDANFVQKRRKSSQVDPTIAFEPSRFLPQEDVDAMEAEVERKRKKPSRKSKRGKVARVAEDILDECEKSFLAAQEFVTKASKNHYAETGLMALLCRHDRVLFAVNLTTPGERQHYALALLQRLMDELPPDWRVGVLYDIACQLSRSIEKVCISSFAVS